MQKREEKTQNGRLHHTLTIIPSESIQSTHEDRKTTLKKMVSFDQSKTIKRPFQVQKKKQEFSNFHDYRASTDVISFEMEEQRSNQMRIINSDQQLQAYYLAFKKLFTILYQASRSIEQNIFKLTPQLFQNKSIGFLCLIFEQPKDQWNSSFLFTMRPLAKNFFFLANNPHQFQRRIDLVARKVTLQNDKCQKIKNAFLNPKIQRTWEQTVLNCFSDQEIEAYVEDQFDTPQQKFCFIEIKDFIVNKLSTESFGNQLRKHCMLQQLDNDLSLDFKFEFLLAEEFSFSVPMCLLKDTPKPPSKVQKPSEEKKCQVM